MKSLKVITLGCSKNTVDTEHLLSQLSGGYRIVPEGSNEKVDVLLVNTCGFIADAKEQSIQAVLAAAERKKSGQVGKLMVFGCLSQRYMAQMPGLIPEVDAWFGARDLSPVVKALGCIPSEAPGRLRTDSHAYAYLKISEGCDRRCAYCAIPFIRGAHKSIPMEQLEEEASLLAAAGVKELILIAQDTTYYGLDIYKKRSLAELIRRLSAIDGIEWIRIHYSYPQEALREGLLNALVHRDYAFSGSIIININESQIEFISLGGLLPGLSAEDIMNGISQPRNPKLAEVFHRLHLIESYGTGIRRIYALYKDCSRKPEIVVTPNSFKLILPNINYYSTDDIVKYSSKKFNAQQEKIMQYISENGEITEDITQKLLDVKRTRAYVILKEMCDKGFIEVHGRKKKKKFIRMI